MNDVEWAGLLRQWNRDILASSLVEGLPTPARDAGWLGFPPAAEEQIATAEARLRIALPPSYKAFLRTSNGWLRATHTIGRLLGIEELDWFRTRHRHWITAYTRPSSFGPREKAPDDEYFGYGALAGDFRPEHLRETLQISEVEDLAVYLLNPQVITKAGEWEAWFFANWLSGAHRYRSFEEMMRAEYEQFSGGDWRPQAGIIGELPDEFIGSPGSPKRRVKKRTRQRPRKILGKPYDRWTVEELLEMLRNPEFDIIHGEVIEGLALLGDTRAVEPLIEVLDRSGSGMTAAMYALKKLAPERLPDRLLEMLRNPTAGTLYAAAEILAELKDDRAVPLLVEIMRDTSSAIAADSHCAPQCIAPFGMAGYNALVDCLADPDPVVRLRAINGLYCTNRRDAREAVERLLADPDQTVREHAKLILDLLPPPPPQFRR